MFIETCLFLLFIFTSTLVWSQVSDKNTSRSTRFTGREKIIIYDIIAQYKKQCAHISLMDEAKLSEIQETYVKDKENLSFEQSECYDTYLSQIAGGHRIYEDLCNEVTPLKSYGTDKNLARIFANIRKYETGIRPYQEKLGDCLTRTSLDNKMDQPVDYGASLRVISKKIRELNTKLPFKENNVDLR